MGRSNAGTGRRAFRSGGELLLALCAALLAGCGAAGHGGGDAPPTLVLIVADDLGWGDLGCYGSPSIATPRLDGLAREGTRFTAFYANAPVCSPSRASMLSGLYPAQTGVLGAILPRERAFEAGRLRPDVQLLPAFLRAAGYRTALVGKWHLGYEAGDLPEDGGFDTFAGYYQGASYDTGRKVSLLRGREPWETEGLLTRVLGDEAVRVVEDAGSEPLFLFLSFKAPHEALDHAAPFLADEIAAHRARGAGEREALYFAVVEEMDRQVGRVLDALERAGRAERALVAFASDNGPNLDTPGASPGPYQFGKGSLLEGGVRVPGIVRWPGRVPAGIEVDAPVAGCDLFATLLDAAGVDAPEENGGAPIEALDLWDAVRGDDGAFRARDLFWFVRNQFAVRRGRWKLWVEVAAAPGDWAGAVRALDAATPVLFDVTESPPEARNYADDRPEVVAELREVLRGRLRTAALGSSG